ncbi:MAG: DUF7507 domain-containing protein, partial [Clostridium sp.]|uniref:DUF7507 domain-containing protein n=1 Tax=Clostridium sp. TaxID=1506 RepID=UPI003F3BD137
GDVIPYTIVLKNTGNVNATSVLFKDTVPSGTTLNAGTLKLNGSAAPGNLTSGVTVGTLAPNQVATITFDVTITTIPAVNPIPNEGIVDYSYLVDPTQAPRTDSQISNKVTTTIKLALISNVDGGLVKSNDLTFAKVGDQITYTIPIKNTGNVDANNVLIKDTIPNGTSYVPSSLTVDGVPNAGSISSGITLGTIVPNGVKTISFKVLVDTIPVPNPIPNQALIDYSFTVDTPNDTNTKNLSNTVLTTIAQAYIRPSDGGLVKLVDKAFADVGETVTYTVVLKNTGNVDATNVKLFDTIPNDTTLVSGSILVNGVAGTGDLVTAGVTVGTIAPNAVATVQFKVIVNTIPTPNPLVNAADTTFSYLVGATTVNDRNTTNSVQTKVNTAIITNGNGSLTKAVDKAFADINDIVTYTITVTNTGNVDATNVIVKDTIPTDTTYVASSLTVDGVPNAGSISTGINIGTITPNGTKVVVFKVKVNTIPNPNPIPNEALVSYGYKVNPTGVDTTKQALTNNVQTRVNTARISNNDGGLVKTVDKANDSVGNTLTYTITLKNTGNVTANNIVFKDTIPNNTSYVASSSTVDGIPNAGDPISGVSVGTLAPNEIKVVQFKVTIDTIPTPNPIPNQGQVSFDYIVDTVTNTSNSQTNLTNIVSTTVSQAYIRPEDGGLTKTVDKSSADVGDVLTYTIVLKNTGNVAANNVVVSDTIPSYTTYVPASLKVNGVANAGNIGTGINVGTINPNAVVTVQFQVHVDSIPNPNPIINQAKVGYSFNVGTGTKAEEHLTSIVPTTINNASITNSDGGLIKVASKDFAKIGDTITYTINLLNTGNITANNIVLIDTVPSATTFVAGSVMVNGASSGSSNPNTGIPVGSLTPGASVPVSFDVVVTTIPVPNPIKNQAVVNFNYTVDPANPNGKSSSGISNVVPTTVNTGIIAGSPQNGIVKTVDKAFADTNEIVTYTIVLKNSGNVAVNSVVLNDTIPTDTTFVTGSVTVNGASSTDAPNTGINVGSINSGGTATISFKVKVNTIPNPNPIPNDAVVNYMFTVNPVTNETAPSGSLSNTVTTQVNTASITNNDGSLTKSVDKAFADINDIVTYTITVKNSGNVAATNVIVKDTIPTDTTYVPSTLTVDGVANAGNIQTGINIGTVNAGQTKTVQFKVKVNTIPNPNPIPNEALVAYGYKVDPAAADRLANGTTNKVQTQVNTARINNADGGLVKTVDKGYESVGGILTYTITLKNTGNVTATGIVVKDTIPNNTSYIAGSSLLNGVAATGDPIVGIQALSLAPNAQAVVSFKVSVDTIPTPNPIPNQASANYSYVVDTVLGTTNSQNNLTNIVQTTISQANIRPEDGGLTKTVDKSEADVGDVLTYTIVLKNTGNIAATNVMVSDTIPNDTSYVASSLKVNGVANAGNIQTGINVGTINPNAVVTVVFQVHVDKIPNPNPIVNQAKVSYGFLVGTLPKSETHLTGIVPTTINNAYIDNSDGGLVKATSKDYAKVGDTITYTFTLKNTGNIAANNIVLKDTIPAETSFVAGSVTVGGVANGTANPGSGIPVGTITPGQTVLVTFDVTVTSIPSTNPIKNSGTVNYTYTVVSSVPNGKSGSGNSNIVPTTINTAVIPGYPKKGIVKSVDMAFADIDDILTYTVVMKNEGNVPAINVVMQDTVPADTTFVVGSATSNGSPISGDPNTGLNVSNIPPLGVVTVTFKVKVNTLPNPNPIPNNATANYSYVVNPITGETGTGADTSNQVLTQVNTARITAPDGGLIKNVDYLYADVGQTITYTILLNNSGNVPATSVTVQDTIPNDTTFIPGSVTINGTTQAGANPNTGIFVGTLTPFSANTVTFKVKVNTIPNPNPIPNACTIGYSYVTNTITNIAKNVKFPSNIVYTKVNNANIDSSNGGLIKSVDKSFGAINDTLTYTIVVKNTGNVDALNVLFKDTVPNSTMLITGSVTVNGVVNSTANLSTGVPLGTVPPNVPTTIQFKVLVTDTMP